MTAYSIEKNLAHWFEAGTLKLPTIYLVGGAVRDYLLKRPSNDLDLVCKQAAGAAESLAEKNSAALVRFEKKPGETCYRVVDRTQSNNFIDLVEMRDGDILSDLARRDFTINAMAMRVDSDGRLGDLVDPNHGLSDLKTKMVRMVYPHAFADDPLRILRAWRFAAELEYQIDEVTRDRLAQHVQKLSSVAVERIIYELFRILAVKNAGSWVREMSQLAVMDSILPEKREWSRVIQKHADWNSSLLVLENCETILSELDKQFGAAARLIDDYIRAYNHLPLLKLAALFHDIRQGSKDQPENLACRLKLSKRDRNFFQHVLAAFSDVLITSGEFKSLSGQTVFFRTFGDEGIAAIILAMAVSIADSASFSDGSDRRPVKEILTRAVQDYLGQIRSRLLAADLINGDDLKNLGMHQGRRLGAVLREVRRAQDEGLVTTRQEALQYITENELTDKAF